MKRKFESELGKRIVRGSRRASQSPVALAALVSAACAIILGASAMMVPALAVPGDPGPPVTYVNLIDAEDDYLVNDGTAIVKIDEVGDDLFQVKRVATLKHAIFSTPGMSSAEYTKIVYSVNVNLRDLTELEDDVVGMVVGALDVAYAGAAAPLTVDFSLAINGEVLHETAYNETGVPYAGAEMNPFEVDWIDTSDDGIDVADTISVDAVLPDLASAFEKQSYEPGDSVELFILIKIGEPVETLSFSEVAFPGAPFDIEVVAPEPEL